jgi:hypothetical protein
MLDKHAQTFHDKLTHKKKSPVNFHNAPATAFATEGSMNVFEISEVCHNSSASKSPTCGRYEDLYLLCGKFAENFEFKGCSTSDIAS